jgi:hypothetical protein
LLLIICSKNIITLLNEVEDLATETVCGYPPESVVYSELFNACVPKPVLPDAKINGTNLKNKVLGFFLAFWFFKSRVLENIAAAEIDA